MYFNDNAAKIGKYQKPTRKSATVKQQMRRFGGVRRDGRRRIAQRTRTLAQAITGDRVIAVTDIKIGLTV
jgi:hypothetical protein